MTRDGVPVPLPAGLTRLAAFLALRLGPHQRDQVAAAFWPDSSEEARGRACAPRSGGCASRSEQTPSRRRGRQSASRPTRSPSTSTRWRGSPRRRSRGGPPAVPRRAAAGPDRGLGGPGAPGSAPTARGAARPAGSLPPTEAGDAGSAGTLVSAAVRSGPARRSRPRAAAASAGRRGRPIGRPDGGPRVRRAAARRARARARARRCAPRWPSCADPATASARLPRAARPRPCSGGRRSWPP